MNIHAHYPHHVETGELRPEQTEALRPYVTGRHVYDLGAGDLTLTRQILELGARRATAIDHAYGKPQLVSPALECVSAYFHEYRPPTPIEVAFVSWPSYLFLSPPAPWILQGVVDLCAAAPVVAYLGSNFGSVCGNLELWRHLGTREILAHVPHPRNTLIVYGRQDGRVPGQGLVAEEKAALYRQATPEPVYGVTYA